MKRIHEYLPAFIVSAGLLSAALWYRVTLVDWFAPVIRVADSGDSSPGQAHGAEPRHESDSEAIAYWSCSMHPSVRSETPGTCPICSMDLTPVLQAELDTGIITIDAHRRQLIGVKTDQVRVEALTKTVRTVGTVAADETRVHDVTLKVDGWIETVAADFTGKTVAAGDVLFTVYSPEFWSAQQEFLATMQRGSPIAAAETRLRLLGFDVRTIASIRDRREPIEFIPIYAPVSGTVIEKNIVAGSAVESGQRIYRITDLSEVWIEAAIFEEDLPLISIGTRAELWLSDTAAESFFGTVVFLEPVVDPASRTARARFSVSNAAGSLRPSMRVSAEFQIPVGERLVAPREAVLYAGRNRVAFVDLGNGKLQPKVVETGLRSDELIEIRSGLTAGDTVVTSGNFLIAAESKLRSGIDSW